MDSSNTLINIGILEDEKPQAEMLQNWLSERGFECFACDNGEDFLRHFRKTVPDMVVLDWQLPDCEGIDILAHLRNKLDFHGGIIFATGKNAEEDIVNALQLGADDYLIKPLRKSELLARIDALWRRYGAAKSRQLALGPVVLDRSERRATVDGEEVKLTPTEFDLAVCVLENPGKLLSRDFLLKEVWGVGAELDTRTVDMHMSRIRRLLAIRPAMGHCIKTVYRHGYRLEQL